MTAFFLALVLYPQVQRRAQAELDDVVGRDRLPTFDDRPRLPYIEAFCKELMRWQMVTPMGMIRIFPRVPSIGMIERRPSGLPHSSNRDDVYKGYFIPKGQILHKFSIPPFVALPLIIWSIRIYNSSQRMVRRLSHAYECLSEMLKGNPT
jgi:hypothetical protein